MTPAEYILTNGHCQYCETPITDNDRCGCDGETIYYLIQAIEILEEALQPLADSWLFQSKYLRNVNSTALDQRFIWKPSSSVEDVSSISFADAKRAHDALEKVELML